MVMLRFRRSADAGAQSEFAAIRDGAAARAWLASLQPPENSDNLKRITELIAEVALGNLAPEVKYDILERIRPVVFNALRDRVRDSEFRSVPMTYGESEMIWVLVDAAEQLREGYEPLIARLGTGEATMSAKAARESREPREPLPTRVTALHRALDLNAHVLVLYLRMRVAIPDRLWDQHCRMGQLVRELNCQNELVEDPLRAALTERPRDAFNVPLLVALADPAILSQQEFIGALNCALRWGGKVGFRIDTMAEPTGSPEKPASNPGPVVQLAMLHQIRLDTQKVLASIAERLESLAAGKSPSSLGLGEGMTGASARGLLQALLRRWGPIMPDSLDFPEQVWRPSPSEFALAVVGSQGQEGGSRASAAPVGVATATYDYLRMRDDGLTRSQGEIERARIDKMLDEAETWTVVGETPDSVLCMRRHSRPRLMPGQQVGMKLGGKLSATPFLLGWIQGLQQGVSENDEGIARPASTHLVRIKLLPGLPQAVRGAVDQVELEHTYLLVPHSAVMDSETIWDQVRAAPGAFSLVLPASTFRPERTVRVVASGLAAALRLDSLIQRGVDFDHVRFTPI